ILMGTSFGLIFLGMSFLTSHLGILPDPTEQETVVSQLTRTFVGAGTPYHLLVQVSTSVLLILAANTAFADFPRLSSILARDGFVPRQLANLGDKLVFNNGILLLGVAAGLLIVLKRGNVDALIPLYAIGVFLAFTLSQTGMVLHWWRLKQPGWGRQALINGVGAVATFVVLLDIAAEKFAEGAWAVMVLIVLLVLL